MQRLPQNQLPKATSWTALPSLLRPSKMTPRSIHPFRRRAAAAEEQELTEASSETASTPRARIVSVQDGVYTVEGEFSTQASTSEVWDVLTDYERLAEVFSNIKSSRLVSRDPDIVLHQDCKWEFLIFSGKFGTQLSVREDWQALVLTFELIESSFMRSFVGEWHIQPLKLARDQSTVDDVQDFLQEGVGALVRHKLAVEPIISPPQMMAGYTQRIFVKQVASILQDLEEEMEAYNSREFSFHDL